MSETLLYEISRDTVAPVLTAYVGWVLDEAVKRDLHTLYFLARDAEILREIAEKLCKKRGLRIDCRYLYCSRMSLYIPAYHLLGQSSYDHLFVPTTHGTLFSLFMRAGMDEEQIARVMQAAGISEQEAAGEVSFDAMQRFRVLLTSCPLFHEILMENSRKAYGSALSYLTQERLPEQDTVAVVDSGWSATSQKALRVLLESAGWRGHMLGFYYGMLGELTNPADGEALGWQFDKRTRLRSKMFFSPNVFECMLSAPHGMTTGYRQGADGRWEAALHTPPSARMLAMIADQRRGILEGADRCLKHPVSEKRALSRFRRLMAFPSRKEAACYGAFRFCDDAANNYELCLIDEQQIRDAQKWTVSNWLKVRAGRSERKQIPNVFWLWGSLTMIQSPVKRLWHRMNVLALEALRLWLTAGGAAALRAKVSRLRNRTIPEIPRSLSAQDLSAQLMQYDLVSFDIFDTLVFRTVQKPTDLFAQMARENGRLNFFDLRTGAERRAREEKFSAGGTREVSIRDIYAVLSRDAGMEAEEGIRAELRAEKGCCFANPFLKQVFTLLLQAGKPVLIVSDMYLPGEMMRELLASCGYEGYEKLYVSCDYGCSKGDGGLYRLVREEYPGKRVIHVGDNAQSDVRMALKSGLSALHYVGRPPEGK